MTNDFSPAILRLFTIFHNCIIVVQCTTCFFTLRSPVTIRSVTLLIFHWQFCIKKKHLLWYIPKEIILVSFITKALQFYRICHVCYTGWDIVPDLWIIVLKSGHQVFLRGRGSLWCFQFWSWLCAGQLFAVNDGTKMKNKSKVFSFCIWFFGGLQPLSFEISLHSAGDGKERSREIWTREGTLQQAHWEA